MSFVQLSFCIVDDDLSFGKSLKRMLNARGIPAEYFGSAQSFLDSVPPGQCGYAVVDIHMPGCDGFGLMRKMRDLHHGMPVIIVTGHADTQARELALQNGAIGYLQKPFSGESLLELVHKQEMNGSAL
jgi:FixJ family two-component response regulator